MFENFFLLKYGMAGMIVAVPLKAVRQNGKTRFCRTALNGTATIMPAIPYVCFAVPPSKVVRQLLCLSYRRRRPCLKVNLRPMRWWTCMADSRHSTKVIQFAFCLSTTRKLLIMSTTTLSCRSSSRMELDFIVHWMMLSLTRQQHQ